MLGLLIASYQNTRFRIFHINLLTRFPSPRPIDPVPFGPFNLFLQKRWMKPVSTARTRLEDRTIDLRLDRLMKNHKRLKVVLKLQELILNSRNNYMSVQLLSKWRNRVGLNIGIGVFLRRYPHIFELYTHPVKRNLCCRLTRKMVGLINEERRVVKESESMVVRCLKKLLMISVNRTLHIHALWLIRRELGLPDDFKDSILVRYSDDFKVASPEIVELGSRDESLAVAEVEKWREKEYTEKWLSEFETRFAFPIDFPTGLKIEKGFREKLKNWQRLPYLKPYETMEAVRVRTCGGVDRFEKRAVGILHEFLSLTIEKRIEIERLSHFRRDFSMEINLRELLLKHPGIFYISTKGNTHTVFLREAYRKDCLVELNPVYTVRRKVLDLLMLERRNTRELQSAKFEEGNNAGNCGIREGLRDGDWVLPILENADDESSK